MTTDEKQLELPKPSEEEVSREKTITDMLREQSSKAWGNPENDGTLLDLGDGVFRLNDEEFFQISRRLERWNSIFYKFWELGKPVFTRTIPTAAVIFDNKGTCVNFVFNPDFWMAMDPYTRDFIICHEMLHVILNHGVRMKGLFKKPYLKDAVNATLDVVINHSLVDNFDFIRDKIDEHFAKGGCWIDTVYENPEKIEEDKTFEYYFNQLPVSESPGDGGDGDSDGKSKSKGSKSGGGGSGSGSGEGENNEDGENNEEDEKLDHMNNKYGNMVDDHGGITEKQTEEIAKELNNQLTDEEKESVKELIEKHFEKGEEGGDNPATGEKAGTTAGNLWYFADLTKKIKPKRKWETVIQKWVRNRMKVEYRDCEQWARSNRRNSFLSKDLMIPSEMEIEDMFPEKRKNEVWAFQDTSGSCMAFRDRFFKAMRSIPTGKYDPFKLRLFCFDTRVYDVDIEVGKLKGFGGTSFACLEEAIQQTMKKENIKYPDSVWVITDGDGDHVYPEKPERWHWFLSKNSTSYIPKESDIKMLKDYE